MKIGFFLFCFLILILFVGCGDVKTTSDIQVGGLLQPCYDDYACDDGLTCVSDVCVDLSEIEDKNPGTNDDFENISDPDVYTEPDNEPHDGCDKESIGINCTLDDECGTCNICVNGKCSKGCESDDNCKMYIGLKCNKKLNRCLNIYASLQACGEYSCPFGCCIAEKGLTSVKCLYNPEASKCGLCANGEIFIPDQSKCVPAVCSTTLDDCPELNASSTDPAPECFECKSGEFICKEKINCSSLTTVKASMCTPAGQECVSGLMSDGCSGLPCVDGYGS